MKVGCKFFSKGQPWRVTFLQSLQNVPCQCRVKELLELWRLQQLESTDPDGWNSVVSPAHCTVMFVPRSSQCLAVSSFRWDFKATTSFGCWNFPDVVPVQSEYSAKGSLISALNVWHPTLNTHLLKLGTLLCRSDLVPLLFKVCMTSSCHLLVVEHSDWKEPESEHRFPLRTCLGALQKGLAFNPLLFCAGWALAAWEVEVVGRRISVVFSCHCAEGGNWVSATEPALIFWMFDPGNSFGLPWIKIEVILEGKTLSNNKGLRKQLFCRQGKDPKPFPTAWD